MSNNSGMSMDDILNIASKSGPKTDSQMGLCNRMEVSQLNAISGVNSVDSGLRRISEGTNISQFAHNKGGTKTNLDGE